jgi:phenylacetic acid degradation operon negative regulatory protein
LPVPRRDRSAPPADEAARALARLIARRLRAAPPRAGSLAITLFGDTVAPQGNSVWLGSLVQVMQAFALNPRQVRTAVFRLARAGWLVARQRGRRRYYGYTDFAIRQYARAAERIYAPSAPPWDGQWTLVTPAGLDGPAREELRKRLGWLGFATVANGLLAHPQARGDALQDTVAELGLGERVVIWRAAAPVVAPLLRLVDDCWGLDAVAARFRGFLADFGAAARLVADLPDIPPREAFVLRTLLVHEYRRILLGAADLPPALLPPAWPGTEAMRLAAALYRRLHAPASAHACTALENAEGPLPPPDATALARFGGLAPVAAATAA